VSKNFNEEPSDKGKIKSESEDVAAAKVKPIVNGASAETKITEEATKDSDNNKIDTAAALPSGDSKQNLPTKSREKRPAEKDVKVESASEKSEPVKVKPEPVKREDVSNASMTSSKTSDTKSADKILPGASDKQTLDQKESAKDNLVQSPPKEIKPPTAEGQTSVESSESSADNKTESVSKTVEMPMRKGTLSEANKTEASTTTDKAESAEDKKTIDGAAASTDQDKLAAGDKADRAELVNTKKDKLATTDEPADTPAATTSAAEKTTATAKAEEETPPVKASPPRPVSAAAAAGSPPALVPPPTKVVTTTPSPSPSTATRNDKLVPLKKRGLESPVEFLRQEENGGSEAKVARLASSSSSGEVGEAVREPVRVVEGRGEGAENTAGRPSRPSQLLQQPAVVGPTIEEPLVR
jgi:hypothetical protein